MIVELDLKYIENFIMTLKPKLMFNITLTPFGNINSQNSNEKFILFYFCVLYCRNVLIRYIKRVKLQAMTQKIKS